MVNVYGFEPVPNAPPPTFYMKQTFIDSLTLNVAISFKDDIPIDTEGSPCYFT